MSDDIYRHAIYEYNQLEKYAIPESSDKKELVKYIIGMLRNAGIEMDIILKKILQTIMIMVFYLYDFKFKIFLMISDYVYIR